MTVPTQGEEFTKLLDNLRKAQDNSAMLAHLTRAQGGRKDKAIADGWISVSELLKRIIFQVTKLAQGV